MSKMTGAGVPPAVVNLWLKNSTLPTTKNFLQLTQKDIDDSLKESPPRKYKGALFMGRYFIPWFMCQFREEDQTRDKTNDQAHVADLINDFSQGFVAKLSAPAPVSFDKNNPEIVRSLGAFHRQNVCETIGQDFYIFDVYDFEVTHRAEYMRRCAANQSNHHRGASKGQSKPDAIKEVSAAVNSGLVECTPEAIKEATEDFVGTSLSKTVKESIVDIVANNVEAYANFRTYSSNSTHAKYTIKGEFAKQNIVPAGVEKRTEEQIRDQGYLSYSAAEGDNMSTWMRAMINSAKYDLPCYVFGYSSKRVSDLFEFRKNWIREFEDQRDMLIAFITNWYGESLPDDFDLSRCDVRVGGFLPQHIKRNPKQNGAPTETTIVNVDGTPIPFSPMLSDGTERACLTMNSDLVQSQEAA